MDASGNVPGTAQQQQQQQLASMIRPEQVKRLPHLNDEKKQQHEVFIQRLWDNLRSNPQGSPEYQKALANLANVSTTLMAGMKRFTAQRHQQQQQGLIAQQQAPSSLSNDTEGLRSSSSGLGIQATQILPHIQAKVNNYPFSLPPTMPEASSQAETWLREARNRLAQAMQRAEHAQKRKVDIQAGAQTRSQSGNPLTPQEQEALRTKMMQCNKVLAESNSFMEKFKDQQNQFRASAQQRYDAQNQVNTAHGDNANQAEPSMPPGQPTPQTAPPPPGGPQAHSISSAVSAARNRATSAAANQPASTSPTTTSHPQTSQTPSGQQTQPPQQTPQSAMSSSQPNPNQNQNNNSGVIPAPFSAQSALQQSAANYTTTSSTTQSQPQSATHAHPPQNLAATAGFINPTGKKEERPNIPKNLNVTAPRPVVMPPSRPTLNGGPGVGMPGQMGEPAIPVMPGYVLETSEDGRVLSRKKLYELAREVCGPGGDEKLTPEAEDVSVSVHNNHCCFCYFCLFLFIFVIVFERK
jgi:transcription initiation factor TFIID subunit 12